ncbi:MAG: Spy/CpxP family protein refolding chaperone [Pontibacterium sp.]
MRNKLIAGMAVLTLSLGGLGIAYAGGPFGQGCSERGPMGHHMKNRMADKLNLTEEQQEKLDNQIAENFADMQKNMRALRSGKQALRNLDPNAADYQAQANKLAAEVAANTESMLLLRAEHRQDFNAVLTEEQRATFAEMKKNRPALGERYFGQGDKKGKHCRN